MKKLIILLALCIVSEAFAVKLIPNGSTSQSISVVIVDSSGDPNTGVTIADLDLYCQIDGIGAPSTKIDLVALASTETAWTTGRAIHTGNGVYRIDIPDANLSDGAGSLLTYIIDDAGTSNDTAFYEVQLVRSDYFTATAAIVADTVWDEVMSGHTGETTFGGELQTLDPNITLILADTAAYDTDAEHAAAIWGALTASYTGEATFGGELGTLDPNITAILADTATIDTAGEIATAVWSAAAASYNVEDSFGNIINDVFSENANGTYYLDTLDEDFTTIDLDGTTVTATATLSQAGVNAIWNELLSGHTTVGSAAAYMRSAAYDNRR